MVLDSYSLIFQPVALSRKFHKNLGVHPLQYYSFCTMYLIMVMPKLCTHSVYLLYSYARTIYCDVAGRESRLPLRIRGEGIGPRALFSLDSLDIGNIFVNSKHSYEVC